MRVFLDANILVSVLNKEYPVFTNAARILSLASNPMYKLVTFPLCIGIAFYFAEKKPGTKNALGKIKLLTEHIQVGNMNHDMIQQVFQNKKVKDLQYEMEYYSAIHSKCQYIITENVKDFYFSEIEVLTSKEFVDIVSKPEG